MKPTLYLMCGLPGSGKTTRARALEQQIPALRLTTDEWMLELFGTQHDTPELLKARDTMEALLWNLAEKALKLGVNVVLDYGLWSRAERDSFRKKGEQAGAEVQLVFLDVPLDVLIERVESRNEQRDAFSYPITRAEMELWTTWFEKPAPDGLLK